MRLLVDENVHADLVLWFRSEGHEVLYAAETMKQAVDPDLLELARIEGRAIVTDDLDFGELVFRRRLASQGVILIRLPGVGVAGRIARLSAVWPVIERHLPGSFIVVAADKLRVRRLPPPP